MEEGGVDVDVERGFEKGRWEGVSFEEERCACYSESEVQLQTSDAHTQQSNIRR